MQIEGLERTEASRSTTSSVTLYSAADVEGSPHLRVERLATGATCIEYLEGGKRPKLDPTEEMFVQSGDLPLVERLVRVMAVRHLGVDEARSSHTSVDLEFVTRGFTLGVSNAGAPVWIRLSSPMTMVAHRKEADGIPASFEDEVTALCIMPERKNVRFECGNVRSALKIADTNMAFEMEEAKKAHPEDDETVVIPFFLDRASVVIH